MGSFGGYYKGDKKKSKKDNKVKNQSFGITPPTYVMPEIISKKKKDY